jgi:hypothetical protein
VPLFYFHLRDGAYYPDMDGTELADLHTARVEAVKLAGGLLLDNPEEFWEGTDWQVEVTDHSGLILFRLDFTATDAPAAGCSKPAPALASEAAVAPS